MSDAHPFPPAPGADDAGPWHPGERALQAAAGVADKMQRMGERFIRDFMPDEHRELFEKLPFVVAAAVDGHDAPWVTLRAGAPGFMRAPDARTLVVRTGPDPEDPVAGAVRDGDPVGLLGIELPTRRRNRMNGIVSCAEDGSWRVTVTQSFGNCPSYIATRRLEPRGAETTPAETLTALDPEARRLIETAETVFTATYADRPNGRQVDASHRGGLPGFVRIEPDGALTIPDYAGNRFFMTLGNILLNGRAGLLFIDFTRGDLLHLSGRAQVLETVAAPAPIGAERFWRVTPERIVRRRAVLPWAFTLIERSPASLPTGAWT